MNIDQEKELFNRGVNTVCGIDEAGRGSLAGPIVAGAVVFDKSIVENVELIELVNDSKKLSEKKREALYDIIIHTALNWSVGLVSNVEIDKINIGNANRLCVIRAIERLENKPDYIFCDFIPKLTFDIDHEILKKGDQNVFAIASASIIAKVYRDRIMKKLGKYYSEYGLEKHKGYGTKAHIHSILEYGYSKIHRESFRIS